MGKLYVWNIKTRLTALKTPDYLPETKMAWPSPVPESCKRSTDVARENGYLTAKEQRNDTPASWIDCSTRNADVRQLDNPRFVCRRHIVIKLLFEIRKEQNTSD
jgi:hypothetical protein